MIHEFGSVEECPKCKCDMYSYECQFTGKMKHVAAIETEQGDVIYEHLDITCPNCGYTWQEFCVDAE